MTHSVKTKTPGQVKRLLNSQDAKLGRCHYLLIAAREAK